VWERNPYFGEWNVDEAGNPLPTSTGASTASPDQDAQLNLFLAGELDLFAPRNLDDIGVINVAIQNGDIDAVVLEGLRRAGSSQFIVFNWNLASQPLPAVVFRNADFRRRCGTWSTATPSSTWSTAALADPMHTGVYLVNDYWLDDSAPPTTTIRSARASCWPRRLQPRDADGIPGRRQGRRLSFRLATNAGNVQREQITRSSPTPRAMSGSRCRPRRSTSRCSSTSCCRRGDDRPFEAILIGLTGGSRTWPFGDVGLQLRRLPAHVQHQRRVPHAAGDAHGAAHEAGAPHARHDAAREIGVEIQMLEAELASTSTR
jgi:peptide/nickel transport system substrate-binding protein